jgi:hypothetical protein
MSVDFLSESINRDPNPLLSYEHMQVWFGLFLLALHFLLNRFMSSSLCWIGKSMMKREQKSDWKSDLPCFSYGYWKCVSVDSLPESINCPPDPLLGYEHMQVLFGLFLLALHFLLIYKCKIWQVHGPTCTKASTHLSSTRCPTQHRSLHASIWILFLCIPYKRCYVPTLPPK